MLVPDSKGGRIEVAVLGRGQFVGERSVINDKLRSADCVAQGRVQVRSRNPACEVEPHGRMQTDIRSRVQQKCSSRNRSGTARLNIACQNPMLAVMMVQCNSVTLSDQSDPAKFSVLSESRFIMLYLLRVESMLPMWAAGAAAAGGGAAQARLPGP